MPIPSANKNEPRLSAKQYVYNTLLEWITEGTLQPGEKILDTEIAEYFSVSRTPVREALQLLADQKLIDILPSRGSVVSQIKPEEVRGNYALMGDLNRTALNLCKDRIDDAFIDGLEELNEQMKTCLSCNDMKGMQKLDKAFHDRFIQLAGNDFLARFYDTMYAYCQRIENLYFSGEEDGMSSIVHHTAIIDSLRKKDYKRAGDQLVINWTHTLEHLNIK